MAITSPTLYMAANKQSCRISKTTARTTLAALMFSLFDVAGSPGNGVLAGTSTSAGVVPTSATPGCYPIQFNSGTGYITRVEYGSSVAGRQHIYDMLFKAGAFSYAAGTTGLSNQPAISQRCPDYPGSGNVFGAGNEIWMEVSTAFLTGNAWTIQVTYTDSNGNAGHTSIVTPVMAAAALIIGRMVQIPLASGDFGVQKIESVIVSNPTTAMTAGAFNILILRPLLTELKVKFVGDGGILNLFDTGMPQVYADSAIICPVEPDSTSSGLPD